jgi:hypothetical protein
MACEIVGAAGAHFENDVCSSHDHACQLLMCGDVQPQSIFHSSTAHGDDPCRLLMCAGR